MWCVRFLKAFCFLKTCCYVFLTPAELGEDKEAEVQYEEETMEFLESEEVEIIQTVAEG